MNRAGPKGVVRRALALISEHPGVREVGRLLTDEAIWATTVDVTFEVQLPNEWRRAGESPSGIKLLETVRFEFPCGFPIDPPQLSLRADVSRKLPHMQPWLKDGRPVPCIYDGDLRELLHTEGLGGILNQTAIWLERAALGTLIDPEQGWEPVRRDSYNDAVVANAEHLQGLVNRRGGYRFLKLDYLRLAAAEGPEFVQCQVSNESVKVNPRSVGSIFGEERLNGDLQLRRGKSLALVVWPGKHPSGNLILNDSYLPETVDSVTSLRERAALYCCGTELDDALNWLRKCCSRWQPAGPFKAAVVILARRPFNVIGSSSAIELCPYVLDVWVPGLFAEGAATAVRAAAHRDEISRGLLAQLAGSPVTAERPRWTLIGAGSLGSKLALHLARAGNGPTAVIDRSGMAPHNAARHALVPATGDMQILWSRGKSWMLSEALNGLNQIATPIAADVVSMVMDGVEVRRAWSKHSWAVVNATASMAVREALAASRSMPARVIETSLFAGGRAGVITVEGPGRNPSTTDLMAEFYAILRKDLKLRPIVFGPDDTVSRQRIGQGCGSMTMAMSDGRLSLFAAGMSEYLLAKHREGLPGESGEVLVARLSRDGLSVRWVAYSVPAVKVVEARSGEAWRVHVNAWAESKIREEAGRWPDVETGGVLMGRFSEVSRVAHVVDVLGAPDDSLRSRDEFVLGTKGLRRRLREYSESVNWSLYCLGTWHSHLQSSGPSKTDRATARAVTLARLTPSIFLILTPTQLHALTACPNNETECPAF